LNNNQIVGPIPESLCDLHFIKALKTIEVECNEVLCNCCSNCPHAPSFIAPEHFSQNNTTPPTLSPTFDDLSFSAILENDITKSIRQELEKISTKPETTPRKVRARAQHWLLHEDTYHTVNLKVLKERYILAVIYFALGGQNWIGISRIWLSSDTICDWDGLKCNQDGFVTGLFLSSRNMRGIIPYEIGQLAHLELIDLNSNHIKKSIPDELGQMPLLGYLILHTNEMTGYVPNDVCMLREQGSLTELWVDCNANDPYPVTCPRKPIHCCTRCGAT